MAEVDIFTNQFGSNDILILLGAGCSMDADIPASRQMIHRLETLISEELYRYKKLYDYLKSSAYYSDGISGNFKDNFDIERLVNILAELEKKENSLLYPFIGSWNPRLLEIAGYDFEVIMEFKKKILNQLVSWVSLKDVRESEYYERFFHFQAEYNYPLRVFTLNYDLCFEKNRPAEKELERGFNPDTRVWEWKRFMRPNTEEPSIYLYKIHGSIDWERDKERGELREIDGDFVHPDLIFGTDYKMQYIDPYLFSAYEFRKYALESRVILVIGYSFRDDHINSIMFQALKLKPEIKIVVVATNTEEIKENLTERNLVPLTQINFRESTAKSFLESLNIAQLKELIA